MDDGGVVASPSAPLRPVSCLRAVAHAVLEGEGPAVALAAEIGFDDAKLELPGIAAVPPRPVHGPDAALVDPLPPRLHGRLRKAELVLQHGDGRAVGVSVRKALLELGGVIPARQTNPPLTQKAPIGEAEHCLSNYRGSLRIEGVQFKEAVR
ncbi:hypothetical protein [Slackia piriformis]|uniref:hypothetical protein n=1 Tax=Slackia piriformis TaxID=626934 RepID=UPI002F93FE19